VWQPSSVLLQAQRAVGGSHLGPQRLLHVLDFTGAGCGACWPPHSWVSLSSGATTSLHGCLLARQGAGMGSLWGGALVWLGAVGQPPWLCLAFWAHAAAYMERLSTSVFYSSGGIFVKRCNEQLCPVLRGPGCCALWVQLVGCVSPAAGLLCRLRLMLVGGGVGGVGSA
jgi:hypothetical protein